MREASGAGYVGTVVPDVAVALALNPADPGWLAPCNELMPECALHACALLLAANSERRARQASWQAFLPKACIV